MPQMSSLDWLILSFYFIFIYMFSLILLNFLNFGFNLLLINNDLVILNKNLILKYNIYWK